MFVWLFLLSLCLLWLFLRRHVNYWRNLGVPYIKPAPLVGCMWPIITLRTSPGQLLKSFYNHPNAKDEPFFGFHIFDKPALLIRDPELIKQIFIKDFAYFNDRFSYTSPHVDPLGSRNLFFVKGRIWKALRVALTPTFTSKRMREMYPLVDVCAKKLAVYLQKRATANVEEVREPTARCTTDVIVSCAFGIDSNCLSNEKSEFRHYGRTIFEYTPLLAVKIHSVFFAPHFITDFLKVAFFNKPTQSFLRNIFWEVINEREKSGFKRHDLVDLLIELRKKGSISSGAVETKDEIDLHGDDLLAQATVYFAAGFETTTSTITFALDELSRAPEYQDRARKEILEIIKKHGGINYDALADMTYLEQVIQETLRMYPPLPFLDREVKSNYQIPGSKLVLKKGTPVYIALDGLHYDPKYFPNPDKFDPDRFTEEAKKMRPAFSHLPFGDGPRNCIGSRFGMMVSKSVLAHVLSTLEVRPDPSKPQAPPERNTWTIMTQAKNGIHLQLTQVPSTLA